MNRYMLMMSLALVLVVALPALAHVSVKPAEVPAAAFQTFTMGVPVEKDSPTVGLRLVIPAGLAHVTPNVKPGWKIETKKEGEAVTEIVWSGGSIPAGQRDEFAFSAQVPAEETTLQWKAYQTSTDGSVVAWDQERNADQKDFSVAGPYSQTKIIASDGEGAATEAQKPVMQLPLWISIVALAVALFSFTRTFKA